MFTSVLFELTMGICQVLSTHCEHNQDEEDAEEDKDPFDQADHFLLPHFCVVIGFIIWVNIIACLELFGN